MIRKIVDENVKEMGCVYVKKCNVDLAWTMHYMEHMPLDFVSDYV